MHPNLFAPLAAASLALLVPPAPAADFPAFRPQTIDPHVGNVCYAVTTADVDADGKPDAVAVAEDAVVWYANPSWQKRTILRDATARDNVCIQPHDIDGDGKIDFALGAGWQPANTRGGGTLQWLKRAPGGLDAPWQVLPIGSEPTTHRLRWGNPLGLAKPQLVVAPLQGRGTAGPDWSAGNGTRILVYTPPDDPSQTPWPLEIASDSLHTTHNLQLVDLDGDGRDEILLAAWEGVFVLRRDAPGTWSRTQIGQGNQSSTPFKGASEVKLGKLADGRRYVATIEPWHGNQVVVYTPPTAGEALWARTVVDEPVTWGHAVACADLDGDGDDELVIGQRDPNPKPNRGFRGPGVLVYDPKPPGPTNPGPIAFERHVLDDGGIGCEDLVAADLNGDGRPDLLAGGRSSHNVKVYWNAPGAAMKMKAVVVAGPGRLEVRERPTPEPRGDQFRVRVLACGLNRADLLQAKGLYPAPPGAPADIPGLEFAGTIDALGPDVTGPWSLGDRVFGVTGGGALAASVVLHERLAVPIPDPLDFEAAAAVPEAFFTAHDALETQAALRPGEPLLIHAVGSGVGTAALQLAHAAGCRTFGTSRTPAKLERAQALGLDVAIATDREDFAAVVRDRTDGRGVPVLLDLLGAPALAANLDALAVRGRLVVIGLLGGASATLDMGKLLHKRVRLIGTALRSRPLEEKIAVAQAFAARVAPLFERGTLKPVLDRVYPLEAIAEAAARMESNLGFGKIVLTP